MKLDVGQYTGPEAAKLLGVNRTSLTGWCKRGLIEYVNVSTPDSTIPRYAISQEEIDRVTKLMKRYGKKKWLAHAKKKKKAPIVEMSIDESPAKVEEKPAPAPIEPVQVEKKPEKLDPDKVMKTIMYISDVKERLQDLEVEKANLEKELEELREEIKSYI